MSGRRLSRTWPVALLLIGFPLWWLLGISAFIWIIVAVPMLVAIVWRGWAKAPAPVFLWFAFLAWVLLSGIQLHNMTTILTFYYRFALYATALILFLFIYNLPRSRKLDRRLLGLLAVFWIVVVVGGYLGIVVGTRSFTPPIYHLVPHKLQSKAFLQELVLPVFAQKQSFLGYPIPRPAAPFPYTNQWGGNMALLTLVGFAAYCMTRRRRRRMLILAVLAASVVPMIFSLNRGMVLSLALGILYVTVRLALRGRIGTLASVLALALLVIVMVAVTPLAHVLTASFSSTHGHSNSTRLSLYQQASAGANASPLLGYGAPQQSSGQQNVPAIGTQGQLWMVLFSNGYPALVFFVGFYLAVLWQTRRARGTAGLWLHAVPLVALSQIVVYGWMPAELELVMIVSALAYRRCWRPAQIAGRPRGEPAHEATAGRQLARLDEPRLPVPLL